MSRGSYFSKASRKRSQHKEAEAAGLKQHCYPERLWGRQSTPCARDAVPVPGWVHTVPAGTCTALRGAAQLLKQRGVKITPLSAKCNLWAKTNGKSFCLSQGKVWGAEIGVEVYQWTENIFWLSGLWSFKMEKLLFKIYLNGTQLLGLFICLTEAMCFRIKFFYTSFLMPHFFTHSSLYPQTESVFTTRTTYGMQVLIWF